MLADDIATRGSSQPHVESSPALSCFNGLVLTATCETSDVSVRLRLVCGFGFPCKRRSRDLFTRVARPQPLLDVRHADDRRTSSLDRYTDLSANFLLTWIVLFFYIYISVLSRRLLSADDLSAAAFNPCRREGRWLCHCMLPFVLDSCQPLIFFILRTTISLITARTISIASVVPA